MSAFVFLSREVSQRASLLHPVSSQWVRCEPRCPQAPLGPDTSEDRVCRRELVDEEV